MWNEYNRQVFMFRLKMQKSTPGVYLHTQFLDLPNRCNKYYESCSEKSNNYNLNFYISLLVPAVTRMPAYVRV